MVRERVPPTPECQERFFGWEDKEFSEDFWESIDRLKRSPRMFIITSTWHPRVTSSKTRQSWLSPSTRWRLRRREKRNLRNRERPEESKLQRKSKRETKPRQWSWVLLKRIAHNLSQTRTWKTRLKVWRRWWVSTLAHWLAGLAAHHFYCSFSIKCSQLNWPTLAPSYSPELKLSVSV